MTGTPSNADVPAERADLLTALARHRGFLTQTIQGLTAEQAASTPTASELCLGGLIKHVGVTERRWIDFAVRGPEAFGPEIDWSQIDWANLAADPVVSEVFAERAADFQLLPGETVDGVLADYAAVAADTERIVGDLPDLNAAHPLPAAPWFEPGATWSVRRVLLHVIAETSQHAGHADILRETIDGAKTMG
ncbi:MAG: DinB family protein [Geodermatophilaceae bacterium]|jgi:hypothetical protein|nr:DinB family protein [Geodermatophilaceae bacterium]